MATVETQTKICGTQAKNKKKIFQKSKSVNHKQKTIFVWVFTKTMVLYENFFESVKHKQNNNFFLCK
jgi:hypothetical protein